MIEAQHFLLHATKSHLDPLFTIGRSSNRSDDSINGRVIATVDRDAPFIGWLRPICTSLNAVVRDGRTRPWNFEKFELVRHPFHVPFDSLYS